MSAPGSPSRKPNGLKNVISNDTQKNWKFSPTIPHSITTIPIKYHIKGKAPKTDNLNQNPKHKSSKHMSPRCHKSLVNHSSNTSKKSVNKSKLISVPCATRYWCHQPTNLSFCFRVDIPSASSVSISMPRNRNSAPTADNLLTRWRQTSNSKIWSCPHQNSSRNLQCIHRCVRHSHPFKPQALHFNSNSQEKSKSRVLYQALRPTLTSNSIGFSQINKKCWRMNFMMLINSSVTAPMSSHKNHSLNSTLRNKKLTFKFNWRGWNAI